MFAELKCENDGKVSKLKNPGMSLNVGKINTK